MPDLRTTYLGLPLAHPVVASAGPLSHDLDGIRRLEDGGASAIVLFSLFEEQIERENAAIAALTAAGADSTAEVGSYFPADGRLCRRSRCLLRSGPPRPAGGRRAGHREPQRPDRTGWVDYAQLMHEAGASAIELNLFHIPADPLATGRDVERRYEETVAAVCRAVPIPVAVKLSPFFSATGEMARRFVAAGARGLVLFNRFYQPDFDLDRLEVTPTVELSSPAEIRLPLLWLAILHGRVDASLAATTGVHTAAEVAKYLLAGADVTMTTSALLKHGPAHASTLVAGLAAWLERKGFALGGADQGVDEPAAGGRSHRLRAGQLHEGAPELAALIPDP